jgi:hypothetical protein
MAAGDSTASTGCDPGPALSPGPQSLAGTGATRRPRSLARRLGRRNRLPVNRLSGCSKRAKLGRSPDELALGERTDRASVVEL